MLKKAMLVLMGLSSELVIAGSLGAVCAPGSLTELCDSKNWQIGAHALYLKPFSNPYSAQFTIQRNVHNNADQSYTSEYGLTPPWHWGFEIEGGVKLTQLSDINVNWAHYRDKTSGLYQGTVQAREARGYHQEELAWDNVNIAFAKTKHLDAANQIKVYGALSYVRLSDEFYITSANPLTSDYFVRFNGVGPRVGAELRQAWMSGFSGYINAAASIFAGSSDLSFTHTQQTYIQNISSTTHPVVPSLDAKIGVEYSKALAQGNIKLDLGWLWADYINAFTMAADEQMTNGLELTNFGLQGLYFGAKWVG
jgi:hypothetical protein